MKNKYEEALNYFLAREEGENITVTCDWLTYAEELKELVDKDTPTIIIPLSEYEYLRSRDTRLTKLEDNGVDNWEWYDECFKDDEE